MKYNYLGRSNIKVSQICLGTMTWGNQNTEKEAFNQMDYAFECGVNFLDTAEMYPFPPFKETQGSTEKIIGKWLQKKDRSQLVLATKVTAPSRRMGHIRRGELALTEKNMREALEGSLRRLQVDTIDLYQVHWPERECNFFGRRGISHLEEAYQQEQLWGTLEALDCFVKEGKVREIGVSNETAWGLMKYREGSTYKGFKNIETIQNPYNLLNRQYEVALSEISLREQVSLLVYSPLAFGILSGKYLNPSQKCRGRLDLYPKMTRYMNKNATLATRRYMTLATQKNISLTQLSLAFVLSRSFVTSTIIGATNLTQLKENLGALQVQLDETTEKKIEKIFNQYPNPCP